MSEVERVAISHQHTMIITIQSNVILAIQTPLSLTSAIWPTPPKFSEKVPSRPRLRLHKQIDKERRADYRRENSNP